MTRVEELARFVESADWSGLSDEARQALKIRLLDAIGCAIGALGGPPIAMLRDQIIDFGGKPRSALIGGGRSAPDRAALFNGALVRYLDFNDSYLAKGETCHPSDNIGPVLAAADYADASGRDLLTALAVAYQVQCRLSEAAPVRARGFDHTTQGAYSVAAGVAKVLGLDAAKIANAIAISGTSYNSLRVTRTGSLSHWKGLAFPNTALGACHAAFLAMRGITGPAEVFEGNKGFMDAIAGEFQIDWSKENLEMVTRTIVKKFNAEIHSQSALEAALELREENGISGGDVERVEIEIFDVAHNIIGGGEEGDKTIVRTKEEADHSLQYMTAVALLDGAVLPDQYGTERIVRSDVQDLLKRVEVRPDQELSDMFPEHHACRIRLHLRDGRALKKDKTDYEGFHTRPARWEVTAAKFRALAAAYIDDETAKRIEDAVGDLDNLRAADLTALLEGIDHFNSGGVDS
ncbi:MAG: MmgE/PrpD family protein [Actinomycetota bacterium]|nr:MmgE/PrpD family protein [Actinomycetota bacterium]